MEFVITTPLYYVNDKPHLGSAYTTIACDTIARFRRLKGDHVTFITGVDEHGQKIQQTAESNGISPQVHCDIINQNYRELWSNWNITFDRYIRTTDRNHEKLVKELFSRVLSNGDIYLGKQEGWYCVGCEEYKDKPPAETEPFCELHQKPLEWRNEENLFFRLSKYQSQIEDLLKNDNFIRPTTRQNEVHNFVKQGLKDFSISRLGLNWGIPVPNHPGHTFYVWFDALTGYLTALLNDGELQSFSRLSDIGWQNSLHIIGKDILRFHAVYWPAMLISAGISPPSKVFGHGFITREGKKMSKSIGNVLDPNDLLKEYGENSVRWYLLRDIDFGSDGDFQKNRFVDIVNNDLANTIGNLLNRTTTMSRKWFNGRTPPITPEQINARNIIRYNIESNVQNYLDGLDELNFKKAAEAIIDIASTSNTYLNDKAPWKLIKDISQQSTVGHQIYNVLDSCRIIGFLLCPMLPDLSEAILNQLGETPSENDWIPQLNWGLLQAGLKLPEPKPVILKLEK